MFLLQASQTPFDLTTLLLGEENWSFLPEVLLRSAIMFLVSLVSLRIIGKRGIMQGVFELVTIITLGSAAGDPMFYKKVGLLPAILVFVSIILMYKIINYLVNRYKWFEILVEGKQVRVIKDGKFEIKNFEANPMAKDEFFSDLRLKNISHLGQIRLAYIEPSGQVSIFFEKDNEVKWGLPILPEIYEQQTESLNEKGYYSCTNCAATIFPGSASSAICPACSKNCWVKASNEKRVL
ncbi:MAG: DUF421 domain-containing protein [Chitinophagaceae bacterium]